MANLSEVFTKIADSVRTKAKISTKIPALKLY